MGILCRPSHSREQTTPDRVREWSLADSGGKNKRREVIRIGRGNDIDGARGVCTGSWQLMRDIVPSERGAENRNE